MLWQLIKKYSWVFWVMLVIFNLLWTFGWYALFNFLDDKRVAVGSNQSIYYFWQEFLLVSKSPIAITLLVLHGFTSVYLVYYQALTSMFRKYFFMIIFFFYSFSDPINFGNYITWFSFLICLIFYVFRFNAQE